MAEARPCHPPAACPQRGPCTVSFGRIPVMMQKCDPPPPPARGPRQGDLSLRALVWRSVETGPCRGLPWGPGRGPRKRGFGGPVGFVPVCPLVLRASAPLTPRQISFLKNGRESIALL